MLKYQLKCFFPTHREPIYFFAIHSMKSLWFFLVPTTYNIWVSLHLCFSQVHILCKYTVKHESLLHEISIFYHINYSFSDQLLSAFMIHIWSMFMVNFIDLYKTNFNATDFSCFTAVDKKLVSPNFTYFVQMKTIFIHIRCSMC